VLIGNTGSLVFEGSTVDAYETTLTVADPTTSDKTITLPNVTGTVITTGDTGTVTGTMLANDTIQNVDIKSDAAIAFTKLADLTSAQILVGNGSNEVTAVAVTGDISINNAGLTAIAAGVIVNADINASAAIAGSKITTGTTSAVGVLQLTDSATSTSATTAATPAAVKTAKDAADAAATTANAALPKAGGTMTGNLILDNAKELRLSEADGDGANYTGLKAQAQSGDITLTLPAVAPTAGQVLKANASTPTTLEWGTDSATDNTKMPLAGGTFTNDVTFTGDSSNGLWDKSASAFVANLTGNVTGNVTGNTSGSSGSCTGNAATATALATARTIGGTSFDGSANIAVALAATSTALATARTIGGVSFDGTANITLPGVNASGTQDTSGTAALATSFTVTANNSTDETVYPLFADGATGSQGAETDTGLSYNPSSGNLTATQFVGNLAGNATTASTGTSVNVTANESSDELLYLAMVDGTSGSQGIEADSSLQYNPSTGLITTTGFVGSIQTAAQTNITSLGTLTGLTVSGADINQTVTANGHGFNQTAAGDHYILNEANANVSAGGLISMWNNKWNGTSVADISFHAGADDQNKDDGYIDFRTSGSAGGIAIGMRIDSAQRVLIGTTTEGHSSADDLTISNTTSGADMGITLRSATNGQGAIYFSDGTSGVDEYRGWVNYNHTANALSFGTDGTTTLTLDSSHNATFAGTVSDSKGNLRSIPKLTETSAHTPSTAHVGYVIYISTGGVTFNNNAFSAGDAITVINNSGSDQTITQASGLTIYNTADGSTGNRVLAGRGMATIWFADGTTAYISGAGLS